MTEVMVDLETASVENNAAILTIGAIKFSRNDKVIPLEDMNTFYSKINISSCIEAKLDVSNQTMSWWDNQSIKSKAEVFDGERVNLTDALKDFSKWYTSSDVKTIWSNGSIFDCIILENAFKACSLTTPWSFWQVRDTRTIYDIGKVSLKNFPNPIEHHALHDSYTQITALKKAFSKIKII